MAFFTTLEARSAGLLTYSLVRKLDGQRVVRAKYLVEVVKSGYIPNEGGPDGTGLKDDPDNTAQDLFVFETADPDFILSAENLPRPGDTWGDARARGKNAEVFTGSQPFPQTDHVNDLRCGWRRTVKPYKHQEGEKGQFFAVTCEFADGDQLITETVPDYAGQSDPGSRAAGNPYFASDGQTTISGSTSKTARLRLGNFAGNPVKDFYGNANSSTELMRQDSFLTITLTKNYSTTTNTNLREQYRNQGVDNYVNTRMQASAGVQQMLTRLSFALNRVNYRPLWGWPARHVRFEDLSFDIGYNERGEAVLMTTQTYKIAPPWLTRIPSTNPEAKYRSSYGFDEPQVMLSNKFLNKAKFYQPEASRTNNSGKAVYDYSGAATSSGTMAAREATIPSYIEYVRHRPGVFHTPSAGAYDIGGDIIKNPAKYAYNKGARTESTQLRDIYLPGYGWEDYDQASTDTQIWDRVLASNNLPTLDTELGRLTIMDWVFWNPASFYDATNKVYDYTLSQQEWQKLYDADQDSARFFLPPNLRDYYADVFKLHDSPGSPVSEVGWEPTTAIPSVYDIEQDIWTDEIAEFDSEGNKRVSEKGHPIWVNTIATDSNFHKWPGFPYVPGQDLAEMAVYPAIDAAFDFETELNLPDVPVSL